MAHNSPAAAAGAGSRLSVGTLFLIILLSVFTQPLSAAETGPSSPAYPLNKAGGMLMLDYEVIPVPGYPSIDLHGLHYLHQLNDWLYLGIGLHSPLLHGNYGGFMAFDTTLHLQHKVVGNLFVDGGISAGGGGGGSSINQSRDLSGKGGFVKKYAGIGYDFDGLSVGANYSNFHFIGSLINHSQLNLFVQTPVSFAIGSYAYSDTPVSMQHLLCDGDCPEASENSLTLELNNLFQINPKGTTPGNINLITLQFSHFLSEKYYAFFEADAGYNGLPLYNQIAVGLGYRQSMTDNINLSGQIGVGSGGYAPSVIDTGPGVLLYPKFNLEYLLNNKLGLALSGGYLFAPKGTSRNYTLGLAMNYHLATDERSIRRDATTEDLAFRKFRATLFHQTKFNVRAGNTKLDNLGLLSIQFDYSMNDYWYLPTQISFAYNEFSGYPGYGEILTGLGVQNRLSAGDRLQYFFQTLVGTSVFGAVVKPETGFHYTLSDHVALYAQIGRTIQLISTTLNAKSGNYKFPVTGSFRLNTDHAGIGLTYRFSLLDNRLE